MIRSCFERELHTCEPLRVSAPTEGATTRSRAEATMNGEAMEPAEPMSWQEVTALGVIALLVLLILKMDRSAATVTNVVAAVVLILGALAARRGRGGGDTA